MMESPTESLLMKMMNRILLLAATTAGFAFTVTAAPIAASPKVRAMLDDQARATAVSTPVSTKDCCAAENLAVSPKVQQMLAERPKCCAGSATETTTISRPNDGIAASPKLRQQLNERSTEFQIAPIK